MPDLFGDNVSEFEELWSRCSGKEREQIELIVLESSKPGASTRFAEFWTAYPKQKRVEKTQAEDVWRRKKLDRLADVIIADVKNRAKKDARWYEGYIPDPKRYLRGERWNDAIEPRKAPKLKLPINEKLMEFAKQNNLPKPKQGERYPEYRGRLQQAIEDRENGNS